MLFCGLFPGTELRSRGLALSRLFGLFEPSSPFSKASLSIFRALSGTPLPPLGDPSRGRSGLPSQRGPRHGNSCPEIFTTREVTLQVFTFRDSPSRCSSSRGRRGPVRGEARIPVRPLAASAFGAGRSHRGGRVDLFWGLGLAEESAARRGVERVVQAVMAGF